MTRYVYQKLLRPVRLLPLRELGDSYTSCYVTHFKCSRNGYSVTATEKPCDRYEPDRNRTNDTIELYDRS